MARGIESSEYRIRNRKKPAVPKRGSDGGGRGGFVVLPGLWDFANVFKFNRDPLMSGRGRCQHCPPFVRVC